MKSKTRQELIRAFIDFFKKKGHKEIHSVSLIPENDPSVLFTTAGMHPLVPFLLGQKHPLGKRLVNVQKCIRTSDIDDVGDETHHTFFEMLGNWSLGDYWKKEAIQWSYEFLTNVLGLEKERLAVSCFAGDENALRDEESARVWTSLRIAKERIAFLGKSENWWGPAGERGPCGPDTEMFYYTGKRVPKKFDASDSKWVEIWNDVFMEYDKTRNGKYEKLKQKNVDTGMGVERTLAILNGLNDNYLTEVWKPIIDEIEHLWNIKYDTEKNKRIIRIIADHAKAAVFIAAEGITPSNKGQGYILRKLIRRAHSLIHDLHNVGHLVSPLVSTIMDIYADDYEELKKTTENYNRVFEIIKNEEEKFGETIDSGKNRFMKLTSEKKELSSKDAFLLFQSYGFPLENIRDLCKEDKIKFNEKGFERELEKHQELSRTAAKGKFSSGLADASEKTTRLHTATHLLNEALRKVLGSDVKQKGSNITAERLRFDFNFSRKLTADEIKEIENLVNDKINAGLDVSREEMSLKDALKSGAQAEFGAKYPSRVSVYTIIDKDEKRGWFSKEICTGPHVSNTREIRKFKIVKEESVAAGVRRIKAVVYAVK